MFLERITDRSSNAIRCGKQRGTCVGLSSNRSGHQAFNLRIRVRIPLTLICSAVAQLVERPAVNRIVTGSIPVCGANGAVVQWLRMPRCQRGDRGFESPQHRISGSVGEQQNRLPVKQPPQGYAGASPAAPSNPRSSKGRTPCFERGDSGSNPFLGAILDRSRNGTGTGLFRLPFHQARSTMAIIQAILAFIAQSLSRIVNTAFGWAMVALFGKVPANRQFQLSMLSLASLLWALTVIGIIAPRAGTWLISCINLPSFIESKWIRLAMLPGALILPILVGYLTMWMMEPDARPKSKRQKFATILRGYPFAFALSVTCLYMLLIVPLMKLQDLLRRWRSEHVPVMIPPEKYASFVADLKEVLRKGHFRTSEVEAGLLLSLPTRLLSALSLDAVHSFVARQLVTLKWSGGEIIVHPSDLVIRGKALHVMRIHALIVERLSLSSIYFTWHKEAHEMEDALLEIKTAVNQSPDEAGTALIVARTNELVEKLRRLHLPQDEWNVLYREALQVRCAVLDLEHSVCRRMKHENRAAPHAVHEHDHLAEKLAFGAVALLRLLRKAG